MKSYDISAVVSSHLGLPLGEYKQINVQPINNIEDYRWSTLTTKEPETILWLGKMNKASTFMDIGANIGCYSISAAFLEVKHVIAIEPYPLNFSSLCREIFKNKLNNITPICIALSGGNEFINFSGNETRSGAAEFEQEVSHVLTSSSVLGVKPDNIPARVWESITHLKIDVDGAEYDILTGILQSFELKSIESILIEVQIGKSDEKVINIMKEYGFQIDSFYENLKTHSRNRRELELNNIARNIVFKK